MYDNVAPDPIRQEVWVRQTAAASVLGELVGLLGAARLLPVKGVVTGRTLYPDPADRPLADLDVRVPGPGELELLAGWARERGHRVKRSAAYRNLVVDVAGLDVDVETRVGPPGLCAIGVDAMLARAPVRDDVFDFRCAVPEIHDHAVLLAVNVFKDKLSLAPRWAIEDLRRVPGVAGFAPERFAARAAEGAVRTLACIVAEWLAEETTSWRDVRAALGAPPRRGYARAYRWLAAHAPTSLAARVVARAGSDDRAGRVEALRAALAFSRER